MAATPNEPTHRPPPDAVGGQPAARDERLRGRPVLLASDGSAAATSAARVAAALADARGVVPRVLRVLDVSAYPMPTPLPYVMALADALVGEGTHAEHARAVREELAATIGEPPDWLVQVEFGNTASVVVRTARELGVAMVIMGLRRHGAMDRLAHDETTLHVMGDAPCPVLGVARGLDAMPRQVVVGMDFGRASVNAARAALDVVGDGGKLLLAYVEPERGVEREDAEGARLVHTLGVEAAFARVGDELAADAAHHHVTLDPVLVERHGGDGSAEAASALLSLAERSGAEVIAVGSRRHGRLDRIMLGSVTTSLARDGHRSLLVVPPRQEE